MDVIKLNVSDVDQSLLKQGFSQFMEEYSAFLNFGLAIAVTTGVLAFIILLMQLAKDGDKPHMRSKILNEMMVVGVIVAFTGAFQIIINLMYSIILANPPVE